VIKILQTGCAITAQLTGEEWDLASGGIAVPVDGSNHTLLITATDTDGKVSTRTLTLNYNATASTSYVYDLRGNLIQKTVHTDPLQISTYTYDALNRLIRVNSRDSRSEYKYDYLNRRISKTHSTSNLPPSTVYYLWSGMNQIGIMDGNLQLTHFRLLGEGLGAEVGSAVAVEIGQTVYVPVHDFRGNVVCLVDKLTGTVAESYRYDAYGNVRIYDSNHSEIGNHQSAISNPWLFSGKELDSESGFYYFTRRYYDPSTGRFATTDPLGITDGINMYGYVGANPMMFVDPTGLLAKGVARSPITASAFLWYNSGFSDLAHLAKNIDNPSQYTSIGAFLDGTWNTPKSSTHVWDMFGRAPQDMFKLYLSGPGSSWFSRITGGVMGFGTLFRSELMYFAVNDAYRQIGQVPIFTAGFSRGATAAADFTSLIYQRGLSAADGGRDFNPQVTAVLIDRVGSLGIPGTGFDWMANTRLPDTENLTVAEGISINENRLFFPLTLADRSSYQYTQFVGTEPKAFSGYHFDIGAKSPESLAWALGVARSSGFNMNMSGLGTSGGGPLVNDPTEGNWMYGWERYGWDPLYKLISGHEQERGVYYR
jgi:RHS repeat-associated protein